MCWQRHDRLDWSAEERLPSRTRSDLRVSDGDRQAVVDDLRRHTADGRLTLEEFEERVDEALRARTERDLQVAMRELPSSPARQHAGVRLPVRPGLVAAFVVLLVVVGHWWVLIPAAFFLFGGCGHHASRIPAKRREGHDDVVTYA